MSPPRSPLIKYYDVLFVLRQKLDLDKEERDAISELVKYQLNKTQVSTGYSLKKLQYNDYPASTGASRVGWLT